MTAKELMAEVVRKSVENGVMDRSKIRGYFEYEIEELVDRAAVKIPEMYKEFLRTLGKDGGGFMSGSHFFPQSVDVILKWRGWAERLMHNGKAASPLPYSAFVFGDHQGYQFWYLLTEPFEEDPPVFHYHEFASGPKRTCDHFSQYLLRMVDEDLRLKKIVEESERERNAVRAAYHAGREPRKDHSTDAGE